MSWLHAKAHLTWWSEAYRLVQLEMNWTVNWFAWQTSQWEKRIESSNMEDRAKGLKAYTFKHISLWASL